jgi:aminopeptidase N
MAAHASRFTSGSGRAAAVEGTALSNELLGATVEGFMAGLTALRQPFTERYFGALTRLWEERSQEIATRLVTGLFPADEVLAVGQEPGENAVLRRTDAWLEENAGAPAALRRLVVEARDHLHRSLTAQHTSRAGTRAVGQRVREEEEEAWHG